MIKKILATLCCAFVAVNVYAKPNTYIVYGQLINNVTKDVTPPPGWNFITARVTLSNPNDIQYVTIAGGPITPDGVYLNLSYNNPVDYVIDTSHTAGKMTIEFYDPNSNYRCVWSIVPRSTSATLLSGDLTTCTQSDNKLFMNKRS